MAFAGRRQQGVCACRVVRIEPGRGHSDKCCESTVENQGSRGWCLDAVSKAFDPTWVPESGWVVQRSLTMPQGNQGNQGGSGSGTGGGSSGRTNNPANPNQENRTRRDGESAQSQERDEQAQFAGGGSSSGRGTGTSGGTGNTGGGGTGGSGGGSRGESGAGGGNR